MATNDERTLRNVLEKLELLTGERSDGSRRAVLISELNGLIQDLSDQNAEVKKSVRELTAQFNASSASFKEEILLRADENSALAQIITTLKAQVGENIAQIQDTKRALATKTMAMAEHISALSAQVGKSQASIIEEQRVRVTDKEALAQTLTSINATITLNNSTLTASINEERTARVNADGAFAQDLLRVEASATKKRAFRQTTPPANDATNNLVAGDLWFNTDNNNKPYYWTGSAWENVANLQDLTGYATTASVTEEQTARVNADGAVAQSITAATAGTSRVYTQTTAPSSSGRLNGDVWYNTSVPVGQVAPAFTPYVWYNGVWNNNSSGTFTKYIGTLAAINTVASAAYNGDTGSALATYKNTVSNYWALRGILGGTSNDILTVTGIRKADGSSPADYKIRFGDGTATTTVEIYGNLIVNGSINVSTSGGTIVSPIAANAITQGVFNEGFGIVGNTWIYANTADDVFLAIAVYVGGDTNAIAGFNKNLRIQYQAANVGQPAPILGFALSGVNNSLTNVLALNYGTTSATTMVRVTAGTTGPVRFNATTDGLSAKVFLYVLRLSR